MAGPVPMVQIVLTVLPRQLDVLTVQAEEYDPQHRANYTGAFGRVEAVRLMREVADKLGSAAGAPVSLDVDDRKRIHPAAASAAVLKAATAAQPDPRSADAPSDHPRERTHL